VQSLERQALFDHLTGLYSRGKTEEAMRQAIAHAQRYKTPLALAMFDIDLFKRINDTWGHDMGDEVLRSLANRVRQTVRGADVVGRWGGEEFLLLLPETRLEDAMLVAENIRKKVEDCNYSPVPVVTVSLGVAGYQLGDTPETLVKKADEALYAAKEAGRNRVVAHTGSGYREAAF
jgi:diguanylate cyclase (GGDEF)-like protein